MITKSRLKKTINDLPEEFTLEELMDKLILLDKIAKGDEDSKEGRTISEEALEKEMQKWFK